MPFVSLESVSTESLDLDDGGVVPAERFFAVCMGRAGACFVLLGGVVDEEEGDGEEEEEEEDGFLGELEDDGFLGELVGVENLVGRLEGEDSGVRERDGVASDLLVPFVGLLSLVFCVLLSSSFVFLSSFFLSSFAFLSSFVLSSFAFLSSVIFLSLLDFLSSFVFLSSCAFLSSFVFAFGGSGALLGSEGEDLVAVGG